MVMSWTITKWEIKSTFRSRKFLFIFIFQIVTLFLVMLIFNGVLQMMNTGEEVTLLPSLGEFAVLDVNDPQGIIRDEINPDVVSVHTTDARSPMGRSLLLVESDGLPFNAKLFLDSSTPMSNIVKDEVESAVDRSSQKITSQIMASMERKEANIREETVGESLPLKLINKVMVAILLVLPLFLFGNLIIDSIVGEKERKTGESLIAMPISRSHIILGKSMAVIVIMAIQLIIWMIIIMASGFRIPNAPLIYLILVLTAVPVVGLTSLVAVYSKNYKEAGIGITFVYIIVIGFLIVPALVYVSQGRGVGPLILIMKLLGSENITISNMLLTFSGLVVSSIIFYGLALWLFERDDILFGPRPGVLKLLRGLL